MSGMASGSLQATWYGHVATTRDALILFEACLNGTLHHVPRRPHDRERSLLIKSGCVFIYEENASGIKRWTDGVPWSPSRILGNFLIYRELMKPFPPGEKKRATKRNKRPSKAGEPYPRPNGDGPASPETGGGKSDGGLDGRESERALIGSLVDSYGFKEGGLVKKTMSVNVHGVHHHLVSYYKVSDVLDGALPPTSKDPRFNNVEPRTDLIARQNFRAPLDEVDDGMQEMDGIPQQGYVYDHGGYDTRRPPPMMHGSHGHHPPPMHIPLYSALPYSSVSHGQPSLNSYASTTQGFYPANHTAQPVPTKAEDYNSAYNNGYQNNRMESHGSSVPISNDRGGAPSNSTPNYAYRSGMPGLVPRPNGMMESPSSNHDAKGEPTNWNRSGGPGVYAPTAPHPAPLNPPAPYSSSQQWSVPASTSTLPRPEGTWAGQDTPNWGMQSHMAARASAYHGTPQNN